MATTLAKKLPAVSSTSFESLSISENKKCINKECTHTANLKCLVCDQSLYCGKECYVKCESRHGLQCLKTFALKNNNFRKVIFTSQIDNSQLVLMNLKPLEDIGFEIHKDSDQFFFTVKGKIEIQTKEYKDDANKEVIRKRVINENQAITEDNWIRQGTEHNIVNISNGGEDAKLITFYTKAQHKDGVIHKTKAEAEEDEKKEELLEIKKFNNSSSGGSSKTQLEKLMMLSSASYKTK